MTAGGSRSGATRLSPPHFGRPRLTPGAFLESRFLQPLGLSQGRLARALGVSRRRINEIIRGHRAISLDTAIRLGDYFGTGPEFWMRLQSSWDMHRAAPAALPPPLERQ